MVFPHAAREYSAEDYGTCRYVLENQSNDGTWQGVRVAINDAGASLTVARAKRLKLLNLLDDDVNVTTDGELVKLTGLGVKTAKEAVRLGIASV